MRSKKYYMFFDLLLKRKEKDNEKIFYQIWLLAYFCFAVESGCTSKFHVTSSTLILCSVVLSILTLGIWVVLFLSPGSSCPADRCCFRCSLHSELFSTGYIFRFKQLYIYLSTRNMLWQVILRKSKRLIARSRRRSKHNKSIIGTSL